MRLTELVERLGGGVLTGDASVAVKGISHDSRRISRGDLFAALPGQRTHGVDFLDQALARGAVAVLSSRQRPRGVTVPWIRSSRPRRLMALAAWALAGDPQRELLMVGITGTNGKSTAAHLTSLILAAAKIPSAFSGTLGCTLPSGASVPTERTTPEATDLAPLLRRSVAEGGRAAVMEVSSHALVEERLAGLEFQVAAWTNLSRDHLDYHGDMESYFLAKRRLFDEHLAPGGRRVLPVEDPWGARLLDEVRPGDVAWGLGHGDVCAREVSGDLEGSRFTLPSAPRRRRSGCRWLAFTTCAMPSPPPPPPTPPVSSCRRSAPAWRRRDHCRGGSSGSRPACRSRSSSTTPTRRTVCGPCSRGCAG